MPPLRTGATLFLAGDVMTGRGVDQILRRSVDPVLHEPYVKDAREYVRLAEEVSGPIPEDVAAEYVWGDALAELARVAPDVRIVNLETAVTTSETWWPDKAIHYRMHPENVDVLRVADLNACVLGNNHVLDWGRPGLAETLRVLDEAGLAAPGAGPDAERASAPAVLETRGGRVLVFSYGSPSAGVYPEWAAGEDRSGVNVLFRLGAEGADRVADDVREHRRDGDLVVVSVHWGGNWGHEVPADQREFAHRLVEAGAADVVHGHSSHHPKALEIHRGRLILYGAGDFLNDYEGIGGRDSFRSDLTLMYFPELSPSGALAGLSMTPLRIRRFRLQSVGAGDARWLASTLDRESRRLGTRVELTSEGRLGAEPM